MKILSTCLGILAVVNVCLILASINNYITKDYMVFGVFYCGFHLTYQAIMKEGLFEFLN